MRLSAILSPPHRSWLRQAVRILAAVFLADGLAYLCGLGLAGWALITAAICTSTSITGTWTAGRDQIIGALIGAAAGTAAIELSLLGYPRLPVFACLLAPLALLAAARPATRLSCVTLMVVFLFPSVGDPFERPLQRVAAILIGASSSLAISYLVLRARARASAFGAASSMLRSLHALLHQVLQGPAQAASRDSLIEAANASIRTLADAVVEARHEHLSALESADPLLVRLLPMMRRLQSDVLFVTRAADERGDPASLAASLRPIGAALERVFDGLAQNCDVLSGVAPTPAEGCEDALAALDQALAQLGDSTATPFGFTLQMLRRDLGDMSSAVAEHGGRGRFPRQPLVAAA